MEENLVKYWSRIHAFALQLLRFREVILFISNQGYMNALNHEYKTWYLLLTISKTNGEFNYL
jgi:hypothetical protein